MRDVAFQLVLDVLARLRGELTVMHRLDGRLEPERDQQAHRDRQQVDDEVAPAVDGFMRRMDIEHGESR